ncbi:MAG: glycosyltransferase family 2 protein, partial [Ferruginibacter sp.]
MDLSIILVNYKSPQLVLNCVQSIYEQTKEITFEILLVDNASGDNSKEIILTKYPQIKWIQLDYNAGFARGNNAAIKVAKGELILLLNTDTIVLDNALEKALALYRNEIDIAACGVQLLNTDGSNQISGAHFVKGGLNLLLPLPYLGSFIRYWGYRLNTKVPGITSIKDKIEVDWIVGAFILTSKTIIKKAGMLDEDFFMYAEEIEWCSRLKNQGGMYLFSDPKVIHIGGGTSGDFYDIENSENNSDLWSPKGRQILLSNLVRIRKQYGILTYLMHNLILLVEIIIFLIGLPINKLFKLKKYKWGN